MRGFDRAASAPLRPAGRLRTVFVAAFGGAALIGTSGAVAGPATVTQTANFPYSGFNPCTGEGFFGTGRLHFLLSENLSASGAIEHHLDARIDGLQAVTLSGQKYVAQDSFDDEFVFSGASEETFDITAHFIRLGEDGTFVLGDDFYEYLRTHITANADGVVTAFHVATNGGACQ
jgi:hypothetical protein